eukprot:1150862-Pelagomonas_calceolata.AAC.2
MVHTSDDVRMVFAVGAHVQHWGTQSTGTCCTSTHILMYKIAEFGTLLDAPIDAIYSFGHCLDRGMCQAT